MTTKDEAFAKFKDALLNVSMDNGVGADILRENATETVNLIVIREALKELREFVMNQFTAPGYRLDSVLRIAVDNHYQVTITDSQLRLPMVLTFITTFDTRAIMGDLGECQIHTYQRPYIMPDGLTINSIDEVKGVFSDDEMCSMNPMHWVQRALNVRRHLVNKIFNSDLLDPSESFEILMQSVHKFLAVVKIGQPPIMKESNPTRFTRNLRMSEGGSFFLAVTNRTKILFSIRF